MIWFLQYDSILSNGNLFYHLYFLSNSRVTVKIFQMKMVQGHV